MLCAGDEIDARLGRRRQIVLALGIGGDQRGRAIPVFRRVVDVEQLRHGTERACAIEHGGLGAGDRIARRRGGERKVVGRIDVVFEHAEMPGRHREAIVEAALAAARDMDERAVEHRLAVLVDIEAAQQHGLDQTAGLRDAEDRGLLRRRRSFQRIVAQVGQEIADARHAERDDDRIARRVGELIDASRLEAAVELDLGRRAAARRVERTTTPSRAITVLRAVRPIAPGELRRRRRLRWPADRRCRAGR